MGDGFSAFLNAIPAAASSPLALIAYLATVVAWLVIALRVRRLAILMEHIEKLPEPDRIKAIKSELRNISISERFKAKDYLQHQRQTYILYGFFALSATVAIVVGLSVYEAFDRQDRAEGLTEKILVQPSSEFMSAVNVLSNGPQMVSDAGAEIGPAPTDRELDAIVDRLVLGRMTDPAEISQRLHEMFGGGKVQDVSNLLNRAAGVLDKEFEPLADCYRRAECSEGSRFTEMCAHVNQISKALNDINVAASNIDGVTLNASGAPALFGDGSIDPYFEAVSAKNVTYLSDQVCR